MPGEGPGGAAGVLRFSCGALAAHPYDESDRVCICDDSFADGKNAELWFARDDADDGVQTGAERGETLASSERTRVAGEGDRWNRISGRYFGYDFFRTRRLISIHQT